MSTGPKVDQGKLMLEFEKALTRKLLIQKPLVLAIREANKTLVLPRNRPKGLPRAG